MQTTHSADSIRRLSAEVQRQVCGGLPAAYAPVVAGASSTSNLRSAPVPFPITSDPFGEPWRATQ